MKLTKVLNDGRFVFCKDGTYFSVTSEQAKEMNDLIDAHINNLDLMIRDKVKELTKRVESDGKQLKEVCDSICNRIDNLDVICDRIDNLDSVIRNKMKGI